MALDVSSSISLAGVVLTALGGIIAAGTYIVSLEKRLNGKATLLQTLTEIKSDQKEQGQKVESLSLAVARIEEHLKSRRS